MKKITKIECTKEDLIKLAQRGYDKGYKEGKIDGYNDKKLHLKEMYICAKYL